LQYIANRYIIKIILLLNC